MSNDLIGVAISQLGFTVQSGLAGLVAANLTRSLRTVFAFVQEISWRSSEPTSIRITKNVNIIHYKLTINYYWVFRHFITYFSNWISIHWALQASAQWAPHRLFVVLGQAIQWLRRVVCVASVVEIVCRYFLSICCLLESFWLRFARQEYNVAAHCWLPI